MKKNIKNNIIRKRLMRIAGNYDKEMTKINGDIRTQLIKLDKDFLAIEKLHNNGITLLENYVADEENHFTDVVEELCSYVNTWVRYHYSDMKDAFKKMRERVYIQNRFDFNKHYKDNGKPINPQDSKYGYYNEITFKDTEEIKEAVTNFLDISEINKKTMNKIYEEIIDDFDLKKNIPAPIKQSIKYFEKMQKIINNDMNEHIKELYKLINDKLNVIHNEYMSHPTNDKFYEDKWYE